MANVCVYTLLLLSFLKSNWEAERKKLEKGKKRKNIFLFKKNFICSHLRGGGPTSKMKLNIKQWNVLMVVVIMIIAASGKKRELNYRMKQVLRVTSFT